MSKSSPQPNYNSELRSHERRYGKDLAYLLNRLDEIERVAREQGRILSLLALRLDKPVRNAAESRKAGARDSEYGGCRIIQFQNQGA